MPLDQTAFRFRNDDGSESLATWREAINTDLLNTSDFDVNIRIRFLITWSGGGSITLSGRFQYRLNGGSWLAVNASSSVIRISSSSHYSEPQGTTEQLGGSATFTSGFMDEDGSFQDKSAGPGSESEFETCFQIRSVDVSNGDEIELRLIDDTTPLDTYTEIPLITIFIAEEELRNNNKLLYFLNLLLG